MRTTIVWLRFWHLRNTSKSLGIHKHPAIVKLELDLQREFIKATRVEKESHVN